MLVDNSQENKKVTSNQETCSNEREMENKQIPNSKETPSEIVTTDVSKPNVNDSNLMKISGPLKSGNEELTQKTILGCVTPEVSLQFDGVDINSDNNVAKEHINQSDEDTQLQSIQRKILQSTAVLFGLRYMPLISSLWTWADVGLDVSQARLYYKYYVNFDDCETDVNMINIRILK